jgi:hypothetical protein
VALLSLDNTDMLAQQAVEWLLKRKESLQDGFRKSGIEGANAKRAEKVKEESPVNLGTLFAESGEENERYIQQLCMGIEDDWRMEEVQASIDDVGFHDSQFAGR